MAVIDMKAKRKEGVEAAEKLLQDALDGTYVEETVTISDPTTSTDEPPELADGATGEKTTEDKTDIEKLRAENASLKAELDRATAMLTDENSQTYKSRWEALQGQFRGKSQKVDELTDKIAKLEEKIEQLAAKPSTPEPELKMEDDPEYKADIEDGLGPRQATLNYQFRQKMAALEGETGKISEEVKATKGKATEIEQKAGRLEEYQAATSAERYATAESEAVPDWDTLMGTQAKNYNDQNPKFGEFLNQTVRGKTNLEWLKEFKANWDVQGVKEIFDAGRAFAGAKTETKQKPSERAEGYIEPDQTASRTFEPTGETPKIKRSQIKEFQRQIRAKQFKGTAEEREAFRRRIDDAILNQSVIEDV
jgi:predicted nuclease with TOPRIM domain